jgi:hypothetical protein
MEENQIPGKNPGSATIVKKKDGFKWTKKTNIRKAGNCTTNHSLHLELPVHQARD